MCTLRCSPSQGCRNLKSLPHVSNSLPTCWYGQLQRSLCNRKGVWCVYFSSSTLQLKKLTGPSFLSGGGQAVAHCRRSLYVSFLTSACHSITHDSVLYPSWEFFTTLDYEWNVIRGRLPYRWTIWVRGGALFCFLRGGDTSASD